MTRTIPLNKLVTSPRNVRSRTDEQADLALKADIAAHGLLQNLVVTAVRKPKGCFAVEAGERRRRTLQALADEGALPTDFPVACLVLEGEELAREASLAENFQRLSMNPADECRAFQALLEQGADAEAIARRFGLTVRFVEGRLRLATLAPEVFAALGAGEISLDVAKAYAATADRERQAWVFEQLRGGYSAHHPDSIRRMVTQASVAASDRRARLIGEDAYVAAGGRIEQDLFADDGAARWLDVPLLERLAAEKVAAIAEDTAAQTGLAFVRPTLEGWVGYAQLDGLQRVRIEPQPLTEDETATVVALEEEIGGLIAIVEDEDTGSEARAAAETQVRALDARIDAILDKPPVIDASLKPSLGAFLVLDEDGTPRLDEGFYTEIVEVAAPDEPGSPPPGDPAGGQASTGLSRRLMDELAMQRREILAHHLAADPRLAGDLATFLMVEREAGYSGERTGFSLTAVPPSPVADIHLDGAATMAREQAYAGLDFCWTEGASLAERFDRFRALPKAGRDAWLGHAVARTLEASVNLPGQRACAFHDHLGRVLGIDEARWWRPTGANYFDRVARSLAVQALEAIGASELAQRHAKSRKAELAQACERLFAGETVVDAGVKRAALAWVPEPMRFGAPPEETGATSPQDAPSDDGASVLERTGNLEQAA